MCEVIFNLSQWYGTTCTFKKKVLTTEDAQWTAHTRRWMEIVTKAHLQPMAQVNLKGNDKQGIVFH